MLSLYSDIDGTIVDTRPLVRRAYADVGIDMPDEAWGLRWQDWLVAACGGDESRAAEIHARKIDRYTALLTRYDMSQFELPAARLARTVLLRDAQVTYLTAGSPASAFTLLRRLNVSSMVYGNLTYEQRLARLRHAPRSAVYLDDRLDTITRLAVDLPNLATVAITGQSYDTLVHEVKHAVHRERTTA